jgi:dTDP-4-dehydrorhamnose 3,5-epimerase
MKFNQTSLQDVLVIEPGVFDDQRGFFLESWNRQTFADAGHNWEFVQDNHSRSGQGTLRGLHFQTEQAQGKLVRVTAGEVFDVVVDLRRSSPSFGQWLGVTLSAGLHNMLWLPPGCAHGFYVLSEYADFLYKATDYYQPRSELSLRWDDPHLGIKWPLVNGRAPSLSDRDARGLGWEELPFYE